MHEFGYTFDEIANLTPGQLAFLTEGLDRYAKEIRKAQRRRRSR